MTSRRALWLGAVLLTAPACGLLFEDPGPNAGPGWTAGDPNATADTLVTGPDADSLLPSGQGTLRHADISMSLRRGDLQILVTPLDEGIIRTAAPDTWQRLSALAESYRSTAHLRPGADASDALFLVALFTESRAVSFEPRDLALTSQGVRFLPVDVQGLTPGWARRLVEPGTTELGVYAFASGLDPADGLELEYQEVRSRDWEKRLPRILGEQVRIRSRGAP